MKTQGRRRFDARRWPHSGARWHGPVSAEVLAELPADAEGSDVREALHPLEAALAYRMHAALAVLTEAAQLERTYAKALEASALARVHRFERYGPARSASFVQKWSLGHAWRRDKIAAGLLSPAAGEER